MKPVAPVSAMRGLCDEAGLVDAVPSSPSGMALRLAKPMGSAEANLTTGASFGRIFEREPQDFAVALVGQGVDRPIGPLHHVTDAGAHGNPLLADDLLAVKGEAHDRSREGADEEVTLPGWNGITGIEGNARRRDHWIPVIDGVDEFRVRGRLGNCTAVIVRPPAHHRPSVILAGLRNVELIASHGTKFGLPQLAGLRVNRAPLRIAMTVGPDLRTRVLAADERIVLGHRTVGIDAHDLAEIVGKILGRGEGEALAKRDEQRAVRREDKTRAEMVLTLDLRLLAEDHLDAVEAALAKLPACHRGRGAALAWLGIGKISEVVRLEVGVNCHIEQSPLPHGNDLRHARKRLGKLAVLRYEAQRPRAL